LTEGLSRISTSPSASISIFRLLPCSSRQSRSLRHRSRQTRFECPSGKAQITLPPLSPPKSANTQIPKNHRKPHSNQKSLMQRTGSIAQTRSPGVRRKEQPKQPKEKSRNLQPKNSANPSKGPQKPTNATPCSPRVLVCLLLGSQNFLRSWNKPLRRHLDNTFRLVYRASRARSLTRTGRVGSTGSRTRLLAPLLRHPPRDLHPDTQSLAKLVCIHPPLSLVHRHLRCGSS
jgi:hypothetical protein